MNWSKEDIKTFRVALGLNQTEFAKLLGVNNVTVSKWERGFMSITSSPKQILNGLREKLISDPESFPKIATLIKNSISIGGLSYLILLLLDDYTDKKYVGKEGRIT